VLIQDEARVTTLLDKAVASGKITTGQGDKIHDFWALRHEKFVKRAILRRLNRIRDEAELQEILDRALASGRITEEQEARIFAAWQKIQGR